MNKLARLMVQIPAYAGFAAAIGYLSVLPRYEHASPAVSEIKVSLSHAANRVEPCVRLTPQQIAELPPNMRRAEKCERRRLPLAVEIAIDGTTVLELSAPPSGLWGDGPASVYERLSVAPGPHRITARLRDSDRASGWDYTRSEDVVLQGGRYFTVSFEAETGGFRFR